MAEFRDYAQRGKNAAWRYLAVCVAACAIGALLLIAGTTALLFAHVLGQGAAAALQHPTNAPVFFAGIAATFGALVAGLAASASAPHANRQPRPLTNARAT